MPGWRLAVLKLGADEPTDLHNTGRLAIDLQASRLLWFSGYLNDPAGSSKRFSAGGRWYFTGDMATMDEEGYVYFSARSDDVISYRAIESVPVEVESRRMAYEFS